MECEFILCFKKGARCKKLHKKMLDVMLFQKTLKEMETVRFRSSEQ